MALELVPAAGGGDETAPCEAYSRAGDGYENDDPVEWQIDAFHAESGFVGLDLVDGTRAPDVSADGTPVWDGIALTMSVYTATKLARDILTVASHVEDVEEQQREERSRPALERAAKLGYFQRLVPRGPDEQPMDYFDVETGEPVTYPSKWVPCGPNDEGAQPDAQAMLRAQYERRTS